MSNGTQTEPRIGIQSGPLLVVGSGLSRWRTGGTRAERSDRHESDGAQRGRYLFAPRDKPGWRSVSGAVFEAPGLVAGFDDLAVMDEPVEQRGRHLGVAEDAGPFTEGQVGVTTIEVRS
jgi:hypothetical protein